MGTSHHVVVVGGGFGGLQAVHDLAGSGAQITLIDQRNHHLFQPLLYQAATTILPISEIAWPLRRLLRHRKDVTTLLDRVKGVDAEKRQVLLEQGKPMSYDTLILATGARHSYFGHDDWEPYAPGLKTLEDATNIRRRVLSAFEAAERATSDAERQAEMTFAVIGAGPTGVELVGVIAELAQRILPSEFRNIDTRQARVLLVEAGPKVLAAFPDDLSNYARNALEELGVEVLTGDPVTSCDADGIVVGENRIPSRTIIWAAGVQASDAARWLNAEADRAGRVIVEPDLSVKDHPDVFVIGDTAAVVDAAGKPVPGIAPAAKQMGKYVAGVIKSRFYGNPAPKPFNYRHQGNLATIGRSAAAVDFGNFRLKGALAWWFWGVAHIYFLIGTRSRVIVAWSWLWSYVTGQNSARLITTPEVTKLAKKKAA
ncbi:MAG: NAD(P)/FAD-dependent oxidoreductase [Pseudomonadota bacterium]